MTGNVSATFKAKLRRPAKPGQGEAWSFVVLPKAESEKLPRRGRVAVEGTLAGYPFQTTLEPDGQLSHWLKVPQGLSEAAGVEVGESVTVTLSPATPPPEPLVPDDLQAALAASPAASATWQATTPLARLDWIHWIESAKQLKTRNSRVASACDMLASGERRVCCFDSSGFYSKSLRAPQAEE